MNALREVLLNGLDKARMLETVRAFNELFRYSGTEAGEAAVRYIEQKLNEYGVAYEHCEYDGLFSIPVEASLRIGEEVFTLVGDVYSAESENLKAELLYDAASEKKNLTPNEQDVRFADFRGRIVLTWDSKGAFAAKARDAGAVGVVHICATKGDYIHHSNIGQVWGTPDLDEAVHMRFLPSAGIKRADGEKLIKTLKAGTLNGILSVKMNTGIRRSSMAVAEIPGQMDEFVLVSAHYDSWYEGITDNAVSDAILLEYARLLRDHQGELRRGVRIAWWSGHSDGRFAGSTWYCDSHWRELNERCVAHVNLDLTGCKNSEQIVARTICSEGLDYTGKLIEKYTGRRPQKYIPMVRGADQSFFGVDVPVTIMLKYEPIAEKRLSDCPSGGPWWHTPQDTIDKLDEAIMMRDAKINMELVEDLANVRVLPVAVAEFSADLDQHLTEVLKKLPEAFDMRPLRASWKRLQNSLAAFAAHVRDGEVSDADFKRIIGRLAHTVYCCRDRYHQDMGPGYGVWADLVRCGAGYDDASLGIRIMMRTAFMRASNRICDELDGICDYIDRRFE